MLQNEESLMRPQFQETCQLQADGKAGGSASSALTHVGDVMRLPPSSDSRQPSAVPCHLTVPGRVPVQPCAQRGRRSTEGQVPGGSRKGRGRGSWSDVCHGCHGRRGNVCLNVRKVLLSSLILIPLTLGQLTDGSGVGRVMQRWLPGSGGWGASVGEGPGVRTTRPV